MSYNSLRLRLAAAGAVAILVSLAFAALGLDLLFERHVRRLASSELSFDLDQVAAGLGRDADGGIAVIEPPTDPRYARPLSGRYWQVETDGGLIRSRSLWDSTLVLPAGPPAGVPRELTLVGPRGEPLVVLERRFVIGDQTARAAVAIDRSELRTATRAFVRDLAPYLALLAALLIAAGWAQLAVGLRPLAALGTRVARVRSGAAPRLGDDFPEEVRPLASEVDALIEARERELARARSRASDLAHGLKTPLQALIGEAGRLRAAGAGAAADGIEEIAEAMRRHVDRELARARIAAGGRAVVSDPARIVERLLNVLRRTDDGARVEWRIDVPDGIRARIDPDDLTEGLGAILENAARHAAGRVWISATLGAGTVVVRVRDDGPGMPDGRLEELLRRGSRLDEAGPGAGLGLPIAREIAEAAGGALIVRPAATGLEVALSLPPAT